MTEEALFEGNRFSYTNCHTADLQSNKFVESKAREYYNSKYASQFQQPGVRGIYIPNIPYCIGPGAIKALPTPAGQVGDPTLKDNGDVEKQNAPKKSKVYVPDGTGSTGGSGSKGGSTTYGY